MEKQQLRKTIEELRAAMSRAESVDPEMLAELRQLTDELQHKLDERDELTPEDIEPHSVSLKDQLLKLESEHPQLADSIGRVADALAAMGI